MRILHKILILPFNFILRVLHSLRIGLYLYYMKAKGLEIGNNYSFFGIPLIKLVQGSKIVIGDNFLANSDPKSNVAGIIMPTTLATITSEAKLVIGDNVMVSGASIVAACSITIGNNVTVGTGVCIWDTNFHPMDAEIRAKTPNDNVKNKEIYIGDNVFIGGRAIILKGVSIGENSIVGAGSVVSSNIESNSIYAGNPAKFIRKID